GRSARRLARELAAVGLVTADVLRVGVVVRVDGRAVAAVLRTASHPQRGEQRVRDQTNPHDGSVPELRRVFKGTDGVALAPELRSGAREASRTGSSIVATTRGRGKPSGGRDWEQESAA